jgi:hypothetical protein
MERELHQVLQKSRNLKVFRKCVHGSVSWLNGACLHVVFKAFESLSRELQSCRKESRKKESDVVKSLRKDEQKILPCHCCALSLGMQLCMPSCKGREHRLSLVAGTICFR